MRASLSVRLRDWDNLNRDSRLLLILKQRHLKILNVHYDRKENPNVRLKAKINSDASPVQLAVRKKWMGGVGE